MAQQSKPTLQVTVAQQSKPTLQVTMAQQSKPHPTGHLEAFPTAIGSGQTRILYSACIYTTTCIAATSTIWPTSTDPLGDPLSGRSDCTLTSLLHTQQTICVQVVQGTETAQQHLVGHEGQPSSLTLHGHLKVSPPL